MLFQAHQPWAKKKMKLKKYTQLMWKNDEKKFKALQLIGGEDKPEPKLTLLYKKKYLKSIRYIHQNHNPPINRDDFIKWAKEKLDIDVTTKDLVMKSMNTEMGDDP